MFAKKSLNVPKEIETIIGEGTVFQGSIKSKGSVRVDGKLEGNIIEAVQVIVGSKGYVQGDITAQSVIIGGKVNGNVTATESIELQPGAQLLGDIHTSTLSIGEGAIFEGHCVMSSEKTKVIELDKEISQITQRRI
ncbi:MAG: polymer-forming cytoskeletal protein [Elusimicrobiota bacterium]|nr:polymer-forming cytoskeletal protein [Endomicrobiia bacterium]MDW8165854.1 polymer-forming cytoskeletal protein [Elusimicrobiota bacterium]